MSSKIKVLQVPGNLAVGGLQDFAVNCFRYVDRNKYDFDFLVYGDQIGEYEAEVESLGGRVIHTPSPGKHYIKFYRRIANIIRKEGPYDIIHSHTFFNSGIVLLAAKNNGVKKCIAHSHSGERSNSNQIFTALRNNLMRGILIRTADIFCACSNNAGNFLFGRKNFVPPKAMILSSPIDFSKFKFSRSDRNQIRKELNIAENEKVIGIVGHLEPVKNHIFLLKVFSNLLKISNDYTLLIVGDGSLRIKLQEESNKLNISNKVIFTGTQTNVPPLLSAMDLYVQPSLHEGLGMALVEAQANGLPCVVGENVFPSEVWISTNHVELNFSDLNEWCQSFLTLERSNVSDVNMHKFSVETFKKNLKKIYSIS